MWLTGLKARTNFLFLRDHVNTPTIEELTLQSLQLIKKLDKYTHTAFSGENKHKDVAIWVSVYDVCVVLSARFVCANELERFNNNDKILIKREPLVYTRARRAVQTNKRKKERTKKARTVQQQ